MKDERGRGTLTLGEDEIEDSVFYTVTVLGEGWRGRSRGFTSTSERLRTTVGKALEGYGRDLRWTSVDTFGVEGGSYGGTR